MRGVKEYTVKGFVETLTTEELEELMLEVNLVHCIHKEIYRKGAQLKMPEMSERLACLLSYLDEDLQKYLDERKK